MIKTLRLALPTLLFVSHALAQTPAPAAPTKPAPPAAPVAPAKPTVASPAAPSAPVVAKPAGASGTTPPAAATAVKPGTVEWTLDAGHSRVGFVAKHLGFSKVDGQFKKFAATVKADAKSGKISALEASAETASIDTGIESATHT